MARKWLKFSFSSQRLQKFFYFGTGLLLVLLVQIFNLLLLTTNRIPVLAQATEITPVVRNSSNASRLTQQGKTLYEKEQFADAAEIWQQATQIYRSQNDLLNLVNTLSFLSLAERQLGQWEKAGVGKLQDESSRNRDILELEVMDQQS